MSHVLLNGSSWLPLTALSEIWNMFYLLLLIKL